MGKQHDISAGVLKASGIERDPLGPRQDGARASSGAATSQNPEEHPSSPGRETLGLQPSVGMNNHAEIHQGAAL